MFENLVGKKHFSVDRLAALCHVAEVGSISAATGDNASKQSLYSRQIGELETFFGLDLLDRHSRPYRVTEEGTELVRISRLFLSAVDDFAAHCHHNPLKLVIGAGESLIQWLLIPEVLPRLKRSIPEARVIFRNLRTAVIVESLNNGEIDIGLVRENAVTGNLKSVKVPPLSYSLFVPKAFRAKLKSPVTLDQAARFPMAVLAGGGQYRSTLEELAKSSGCELQFAVECSSSTQVALLVARKECCAILPSFAGSQLDSSTIDKYEVEGLKPLERTLCFAWNPKRSDIRPVIANAIEVCRRA